MDRWELYIKGRLLTPEEAASFIPGSRKEPKRMSTPTLTVVASSPPPLTPNHIGMAAKLAAREEAHREMNMIARASKNVRSTPRKVVEFLRLPQIANAVKGGAGRVGGWISKMAAPAAGFIKSVGYIPAGVLAATGDKGQATIRWAARSVWGIISWTVRRVATLLDRSIRIFGRPGNWLANKLLAGTTKTLTVAAKPVGITYAVAAPLVSSKSGHIKLVNRLARIVVVHRVVRMFVRNPFIAWPLEIFIDAVVIGRVERVMAKGSATATDIRAGLKDSKAAAAANAAVDAHMAANVAANAKMTVDETVEANRGTTIPEAMGKIGEAIQKVSDKTDEVLTNLEASPAGSASPSATPSSAESSGQKRRRGSDVSVGDQPGQPVETLADLRVRLEAEGKVGQVIVPADASREEQLEAAQSAADKLGEDVVAVLASGQSVVVEPTGSVVEQVIEAEGPEMDDAPLGREAQRALDREAGRSAKAKASSGRRGGR